MWGVLGVCVLSETLWVGLFGGVWGVWGVGGVCVVCHVDDDDHDGDWLYALTHHQPTGSCVLSWPRATSRNSNWDQKSGAKSATPDIGERCCCVWWT